MPSSKFKVTPAFGSNMRLLAQGMEQAAHIAMTRAMARAEKDARALKRWHDPGTYQGIDRTGDLWVWEVTGATAATITAYVVPNKRIKAGPGQMTEVERHIDDGGAPFVKRYPHDHGINPDLTGDYTVETGKVKGVVTMYTAYAPYLQAKEIAGGQWGSPSAGLPVTIEVLSVNWDPYYVPHIIRPVIEREMQRIYARLR